MFRFTTLSPPSFLFILLFLFSISGTFSHFNSLRVSEIIGDKQHDEVVPWQTRRSMAQGANKTLVLAQERTRRKDFFHDFRLYTGGWNLSDNYYLSSVLSTAVPFFSVAVAWFVIFGIFLLTMCACYCCCTGEASGYSKLFHTLSLIFLVICTLAAIGGFVVLYTGQGKFYGSTSNTLDYVVSQAEFTAENLRNVSNYFDSAKRLVKGIDDLLPIDLGADIDNVKRKITSAADTLSSKTGDTSKLIEESIYGVSLALIIVAAVMLFVAFLGFLFSVFGLQYFVYLLIFFGWILVAGAFMLSGAFLFVHTAIGDTCVAMDEWVLNPQAHTALDEILPCMENATAVETLLRSKNVTYTIIESFDVIISNVINGNGDFAAYNQSGPPVPLLCNPYDSNYTPRNCAAEEVTFENATKVWKNYICEDSGGICKTEGRLTISLYKELTAAVNVTYGLYRYGPIFGDLIDCSFVRKTFANISSNYCPGMRRYSKWIYVGSVVASLSVMLSLIFWIVYVREQQLRLLHNQRFQATPIM